MGSSKGSAGTSQGKARETGLSAAAQTAALGVRPRRPLPAAPEMPLSRFLGHHEYAKNASASFKSRPAVQAAGLFTANQPTGREGDSRSPLLERRELPAHQTRLPAAVKQPLLRAVPNSSCQRQVLEKLLAASEAMFKPMYLYTVRQEEGCLLVEG